MDARSARAYRDRWLAVAVIEEAERKTATLEDRWLALNNSIRLAVALGLDLRQDEDEIVVWQRWARLKEMAE